MSEMVERVAAAIKRSWFDEQVQDFPLYDKEAEALARAAIEAMREPTEAMAFAGGERIIREYAESDWEEAKDMAEGLNPNQIYIAMIDTALKESETEQ